MRRPLLILVLLLAGVVVAPAQTPPVWYVTFTASTDHNTMSGTTAVVTNYELQIFAPGASAVTTTVPLGKPLPDASNVIAVNVDSAMKLLPPTTGCTTTTLTAAVCYTGKIRTVGPGGEALSIVSDPFPLAAAGPAAAGKPTISKR
jgi:hypothetical protein